MSFYYEQARICSNVSDVLLKNVYVQLYFHLKILKKLLNLNSNKGHGHDNIGIRMRKICGDSFCIPLGSIAKQAPLSASFSSEWEKIVIPFHKQSDKQYIKNYRPVYMLLICGKIFEWLIFTKISNIFFVNKLISSNHSDFKPGHSCINELQLNFYIFWQ